MQQIRNMTSWTRKQNKQHREVLGRKYRPRVVPVEKLEELKKAEDKEFKEELDRLENESLNIGRTGD